MDNIKFAPVYPVIYCLKPNVIVKRHFWLADVWFSVREGCSTLWKMLRSALEWEYWKLSFGDVNCWFYGQRLPFMATLLPCHKMKFATIKTIYFPPTKNKNNFEYNYPLNKGLETTSSVFLFFLFKYKIITFMFILDNHLSLLPDCASHTNAQQLHFSRWQVWGIINPLRRWILRQCMSPIHHGTYFLLSLCITTKKVILVLLQLFVGQSKVAEKHIHINVCCTTVQTNA